MNDICTRNRAFFISSVLLVEKNGDVLNVIQSDETNRKEERKEIPLFDIKSYNEAIVNAVIHNKWVEGNEPMITFFLIELKYYREELLLQLKRLKGFI